MSLIEKILNNENLIIDYKILFQEEVYSKLI